MTKRLLNCQASDFLEMGREELKQAILASEGRTVCAENVVMSQPYDPGLTSAEVATSFGSDLILLNGLDCFQPVIRGISKNSENPIADLKKLVGRPIGVNIEPIDFEAQMAENQLTIAEGRMCSIKTLQAAEKLGFDFICLTGNPGTGVTNKEIEKAIKKARKYFSGLIIAGKMHGAGVIESVVPSETEMIQFIENGADILLFPAIGTVPGFTDNDLIQAVAIAKKHGALTMSAIGTSQETSSQQFIESIAIRNKIAGVDIQHIGDAGVGGIAPPENIFALSVAIRGMRHTVSMISRSIQR